MLDEGYLLSTSVPNYDISVLPSFLKQDICKDAVYPKSFCDGFPNLAVEIHILQPSSSHSSGEVTNKTRFVMVEWHPQGYEDFALPRLATAAHNKEQDD
jgi:hypothetical protein